jgi:four helix bundle protein
MQWFRAMANHYKELIVWQLADELRKEVYRLIKSSPAAQQDFKFRDQLREAVRGIPANTAEGFRRRLSGDFGRFVTIAFSSMDETEERLYDGVLSEYWTEPQLAVARRFFRRLTPAMRNFRNYLNTPEAWERSRGIFRTPPEPGEPEGPERT